MMISPRFNVVSICGVSPGKRCKTARSEWLLPRRVVRVDRLDLGVERPHRNGHVGRVDPAMQLVATPSMAWIRLKPPSAAQPEPGARLLHGLVMS